MLSEDQSSQNYGYEVPDVLLDPLWKKCFENQDFNKQKIMEGVLKIRKYLSQETQTQHLIKVVISTEIHKPLFKYAKKLFQRIMRRDSSEYDINCLYELIWIFTNLCSGSKETTDIILQLGIVNFCKQLFQLQSIGKIISILFDLIGNLAGEVSLNLKISFLSDPKFYSFMKDSYMNYIAQENFHANASWSFANLFRDFDSCLDKPNFDNLEEIILAYFPIIENLLQYGNQSTTLNLLHIFNYLSKSHSFHMNQTFKIIEKYLIDPRENINRLALQIMGNYISDCDEAVDYALNNPIFLEILFKNLDQSQKVNSRKQAAWILSNIFAGNIDQVQKIVSIPTIFNRLYKVLINEENERVFKELIWTVANSFTICSEKSFQTVFDTSIIEPLSYKLTKCTEKVSFEIYVDGLAEYLLKFQKNPNLHFFVFLKNVQSINPVLTLIETNYFNEPFLCSKVYKIREKIEELINRGPITQEQMAKKHLQNFKI